MAKLRREAGGPLSEEVTLLLMARQVLGGPADDGRSSYQLAIDVCEVCGRAAQVGKDEAVPVDSAVAEMVACDAQHIGRVDASHAHVDAGASAAHVGAGASQSIPPALRRQVLRRDRHCCVVPGCRHATFVDVHHLTLRSEGGVHDPDELVTLCGAHHLALHKGASLYRRHGRHWSPLPTRRRLAVREGRITARGRASNESVRCPVPAGFSRG